jgi:hypothetical protein
MAAIGAARLVEDAMSLDPNIANLVRANPGMSNQLTNLRLPPRGSFTTGVATGTQKNISNFCAEPGNAKAIMDIIRHQTDTRIGLIAFINNHNLSKFRGQDWAPFAAHEFFVAEIAHELTE